MSDFVHPKIVAEKLLRRVLPEDLCICLAAMAYCDVQGKRYRYRLRKDAKTICFQGEQEYSCCIDLVGNHPDTDRIIAEYLLIKNDERKYLATANLTQVYRAAPRAELTINRHVAEVRAMIEAQRDVIIEGGLQWAPDARGHVYLPYDPIEPQRELVRIPPRYALRPSLTTTMILQAFAHRFANHERMRAMRWPVFSYEEAARGQPHQFRIANCQFDEYAETAMMTMDDFTQRLIVPAVEGLIQEVFHPRFIVRGFVALGVPNAPNEWARIQHESGIALRLFRTQEFNGRVIRTQIEAGVVGEEVHG